MIYAMLSFSGRCPAGGCGPLIVGGSFITGCHFAGGEPFIVGACIAGAFTVGGGPFTLSGCVYCAATAFSFRVLEVASDPLAGILAG